MMKCHTSIECTAGEGGCRGLEFALHLLGKLTGGGQHQASGCAATAVAAHHEVLLCIGRTAVRLMFSLVCVACLCGGAVI